MCLCRYAICFTMCCPIIMCNITCSIRNTYLNVYPVTHVMFFLIIIMLERLKCFSITLRWEQPHWDEGFLLPMDVFMIHFLFLQVVVVLRFFFHGARGMLHPFPLELTPSLVFLFVILDLTGPLRLCPHSREWRSNLAFNLFFARPMNTMIKTYIL